MPCSGIALEARVQKDADEDDCGATEVQGGTEPGPTNGGAGTENK